MSSRSPLTFSIDRDHVSRPSGRAWTVGAYEPTGENVGIAPVNPGGSGANATPSGSVSDPPTTTATATTIAAIPATSGLVAAPFVANNGSISQPVQTSDLTGGRAAYRFNVTEAGEYGVGALVNAPSEGSNSLFVNVDAEPLAPHSTWHIPVTSGFEERISSWQGSGSWDKPQFGQKYFLLTAGQHDVIVRGRERNTALKSISLVKRPAPPANLTLAAD